MTTPPVDPALELTDSWTPLLLRMAVANGVVAAFGREERSSDDVAVEKSGFTLERIVPTPGLAWIEARTRT